MESTAKREVGAMYKPPFKVVFSNERLITPSGLGIIGGMLGKSDFVKRCNRIPVDKKRSEPQIKDGDIPTLACSVSGRSITMT